MRASTAQSVEPGFPDLLQQVEVVVAGLPTGAGHLRQRGSGRRCIAGEKVVVRFRRLVLREPGFVQCLVVGFAVCEETLTPPP
jgi:hypothetical protein